MALLLAGLPVTVPGETVNRLCASGMSAVANAARAVKLGEGDFYIAGGVENMTRAPYVMSKGSKPFARDIELFDTSLGWRFVNPKMKAKYGVDSMGQTAENVAEQYGVSRDDQDAFALRSQQKAAASRADRRFDVEIVAGVDSAEEGRSEAVLRRRVHSPRHDARDVGEVEAGVSSRRRLGDGGKFVGPQRRRSGAAHRVRRGREERSTRNRSRASSRRRWPASSRGSWAWARCHRRVRRSAQAKLTLDQMDVIELNEAFAAQSLACLRELGIADDDARVNPNGGAIALGHPLGMSGARLLLTAARELEKTGKRYALCTMCIGVGQGMATIIERV